MWSRHVAFIFCVINSFVSGVGGFGLVWRIHIYIGIQSKRGPIRSECACSRNEWDRPCNTWTTTHYCFKLLRWIFRNIIKYIWAWVINSLLPGWGTRSDENHNLRVFGFFLLCLLAFFCFSVQGWFVKSQIHLLGRIVYTSRFPTGTLSPCSRHIYNSISMRENRSISSFSTWRGVGDKG